MTAAILLHLAAGPSMILITSPLANTAVETILTISFLYFGAFISRNFTRGGGRMVDSVAGVLNSFAAFGAPRIGLAGNPFRLACWLDTPATDTEIATYWPGGTAPTDVVQMWRASRSARLFVDVDYGQWGLRLLSPEEAAKRTREEKVTRPREYEPGDIVIGEFLGDQELLVDASGTSGGPIIVALPLDSRLDWPSAADTLHEFLIQYRSALGEKFWERLIEG